MCKQRSRASPGSVPSTIGRTRPRLCKFIKEISKSNCTAAGDDLPHYRTRLASGVVARSMMVAGRSQGMACRAPRRHSRLCRRSAGIICRRRRRFAAQWARLFRQLHARSVSIERSMMICSIDDGAWPMCSRNAARRSARKRHHAGAAKTFRLSASAWATHRKTLVSAAKRNTVTLQYQRSDRGTDKGTAGSLISASHRAESRGMLAFCWFGNTRRKVSHWAGFCWRARW